MTESPVQLLRVFYQRRYRWTRFGNAWVVIRPWMRIAPFFLFGLTHVSDSSPISVLIVNLGVWSMLEAAYQAGVLSWRYFEKEDFVLKQSSLWRFYLIIGVIEAATVFPLILATSVVEESVLQLIRAVVALPLLAFMFSPVVVVVGELSRRISTRFWDLKFIGGYVIAAGVFTVPVLRPFQSALGLEILAWNPIGLPFWIGRSYVLDGSPSAPTQSVIAYVALVGVILVFGAIQTLLRGRRRSLLSGVTDVHVTTLQTRVSDPLDDELELFQSNLPSGNRVRLPLSNRDTGIELIRLAAGVTTDKPIRRDIDVPIGLDILNHSVAQSTYPRLHIHKHDGKHIFSLIWPDGDGLDLPRSRITRIFTKIPRLTLGPGVYFVSVDVCTYDPFQRFLSTLPLIRFEVIEENSDFPETQKSPHNRKGYFQPQVEWRFQSLTANQYSASETSPGINRDLVEYDFTQ